MFIYWIIRVIGIYFIGILICVIGRKISPRFREYDWRMVLLWPLLVMVSILGWILFRNLGKELMKVDPDDPFWDFWDNR